MAIRTCVLALLLLAVAAPVSAQRKPAPEAEVCKNCHADYVQSYFETKHGQVGNVKGPDCQTCHGNADAHVAAGGGKGAGGIIGFNNKAVPADRKSGQCPDLPRQQPPSRVLGCRPAPQAGRGMQRLPPSARHAGAGSTIALKKPNPTVAPYVRTERQLEVRDVRLLPPSDALAAHQPSHHPIIEGKITCSNCHNPHGALSKAMLNYGDDPAALHHVPSGEARPVRLGPPAGRGELPHLP